MSFSAPGVEEDIVAETGTARHWDDGRPLYKLRGESGREYYCETSDIEGVRENIRMYNPSSRYVPPPWWEIWATGGVIILVVAAILVPLIVMGEQAFSAALLKLAKAAAAALVIIVTLGGLGFWLAPGKGKKT